MTDESRKTGLPEFFADAKSGEDLHREFIDVPLAASLQPALKAAAELGALLGLLPDAFVASQRLELERVLGSRSEDDPRVAALRMSIEQGETLQKAAPRVQARGRRTVATIGDDEEVFHGFVSDAGFTPLKGLTVRLTGGRTTLSATTDEDGYFRIALAEKGGVKREPAAKARPLNLSDRFAEVLAGLGQVSNTQAASGQGRAGEVEILKKGKLVYTDPTPLVRERGTIYREYLLADTEPPSGKDYQEPVSQHAYTSPSARDVQAEAAVPAPPTTTKASRSSAPPAAGTAAPRGTKKSAQGPAKSTKSTKK